MGNALWIPIKRKYFNAIKAGAKGYEYRLFNRYWKARLIGRSYDWIVFTLGYPKKTDKSRHLRVKYRGYHVIKLVHPEFGSKPVEVFEIFL